MGRGDLSDAQWDLVKGLMPKQRRGGKWNDHRVTVNGMLWVLRTGAPWRDLPERYGRWKSVYDRFNRWRKEGMYQRLLKALRVRLDKAGRIDWDLWCVDGSSVRAARAAAGAGKKGAKPSRKTRRWVAREAGGDPSSTWSLTVTPFPWPRSSPRGRRTNRPASSR